MKDRRKSGVLARRMATAGGAAVRGHALLNTEMFKARGIC
jgi:hypothetical protein